MALTPREAKRLGLGWGVGRAPWWQEDEEDSSLGVGRGRELEMPGCVFRGGEGPAQEPGGPACASPALPQSPRSCLGLFPPCKLAVNSHPPLGDL